MSLLDAMGIHKQRGKYPDQISGGQKQRVAVALVKNETKNLILKEVGK